MLREREAASLVSPGGGDVVAPSRAVPWYRRDPELLCRAKVVVKEREEAWGDRMIKAQGETTLGAAWCFQDVGAAEPRGGREGAGPGTGTDTDHGERSPRRLDDKDGGRWGLRLGPSPPSGVCVSLSRIKTPRRTFYPRTIASTKRTQTRPRKGFGVRGAAHVEQPRGSASARGPLRPADRALLETGRGERVWLTVR